MSEFWLTNFNSSTQGKSSSKKMNIVAWLLQIITVLGLAGNHSLKNESKPIDTKAINQLSLIKICHDYLHIKIYLSIASITIQTHDNLIHKRSSFTFFVNNQEKHLDLYPLEAINSYIKFINIQHGLNNQQANNKIFQNLGKITNLRFTAYQPVRLTESKDCILAEKLYLKLATNQSSVVASPGIKITKKIKTNTFVNNELSLPISIITSIIAIFSIRWLTKSLLAFISKTRFIADKKINNLLKSGDSKENTDFPLGFKSQVSEKIQEINQIQLINNLQIADISLCLFSFEGKILAINPPACQILGYTNSELLNLSLNDIMHRDDQDLNVNLTQQLLVNEIPTLQIEKRFVHQNGQMIWISLNVSLARNKQNKPIYIIAQLQNITQHKLAKMALQESEASLRSFYDSSPMMMGIVEITEDDIIHLSDNLAAAQFFNITVEEMKNKKASEMGISKEIIHEWLGHYRESVAKKNPVRFEYVHKYKGITKWFSVTVSPICISNNNSSKFSYIVMDITEHKQIQENLERANVQLTNWIKELEERNREIILLGKMSKVLQACNSLEEAHQVIPGLVQPLFPEFFGALFIINSEDDSMDFVTNWGEGKFKYQLCSTTNEYSFIRCDSCYLSESDNRALNHHQMMKCPWDSENFCIPLESQGKVLGILRLCSNQPGQFTLAKQQLAVTVAENISLTLANLQLYEELQQQSIRDPLTGLYNRRYLEEYLEREIQRAARNSLCLGIIMLDVDHFKLFNDKFGHEAGDTVLRELGNFLQKEFRGSEVVCRYGGEEFTIILPEISQQNAVHRAEMVRKGVKRLNIQHWSNRLNAVTISLGVACFPEDGLTGTALMQVADEALYAAKQLGRDRVVAASQLSGKYFTCTHKLNLD